MSAAYTLRYPDRVAALALLSPAGLSGASSPQLPPPPSPGPRASSNALGQQQLSAAQRRHWAVRVLTRAWDAGITPQAIVRGLGRWGEAWAGGALSRRFALAAAAHAQRRPPPGPDGAPAAAAVGAAEAQGQDETEGSSGGAAQPAFGAASSGEGAVMARYLYQITAAPGSGEHALSRLLVFGGAHAREPISPRLVAAAAAAASSSAPFPASITVLYGGTHDWMPAGPGFDLAAQLRGGGGGRVDALAGLTPHSGHHLHMESPVAVAQVLCARMAAPTAAAAAAAASGKGLGAAPESAPGRAPT